MVKNIKGGRVPVIYATLILLLLGFGASAQRRGHHSHRGAGALPDSISTLTDSLSGSGDAMNYRSDTVAGEASQQSTTDTTSGVSAPPTNSDSTDGRDTSREEPVTLRSIPDSAVARLKKKAVYAYANDPAYWKKEPKEPQEERRPSLLERMLESKGFWYTLYVLVGGLLVYIVYRLIDDNNLRFFYRRTAVKNVEEAAEESLAPEDLDQRLVAAIEAGDLRVATRFFYLKTLLVLDDAGLITRTSKATDEDYLRMMADHPRADRFRLLVRAYEKIWYGGFSIDPDRFRLLSGYFSDFLTDVGQGRKT